MPRGSKPTQLKMMRYTKERIQTLSIFGSMDQGLLHNCGISFPIYMNEKAKQYIDYFKESAVLNKLLTLASTQVGMEEKFFAINKKMSEGVWLYDQIQDKEKFVFDKTDYELYCNPIVLAERIDEIDNSTRNDPIHEEFNQSFPIFKSNIVRPQEIEVEYLDENSNSVNKKLSGFKAKVFLHQFDLINSKSLIWWYKNYGHLEVRQEQKLEYSNTSRLCENYYHQIKDFLKEFPDVFKEFRPHDIVTKEDGKKWKVFKPIKDYEKLLDSIYITIEENIEMDLIRAIRKDLRIIKQKQTTSN